MQLRDAAGTIARWIVLQAQKTSRKGAGGYSAEGFAARGDTRPFPQADSEREHFEDFFGFFPDFDLKAAIRDKDILDFGSGYGGKTVEYKLLCGAKRVCGVEPFAHVIDLSRKYAESRGAHGVEFKVCSQTQIPYPDASFDVVLSHDVLAATIHRGASRPAQVALFAGGGRVAGMPWPAPDLGRRCDR
jgi:SAM-dependent methyltransferase